MKFKPMKAPSKNVHQMLSEKPELESIIPWSHFMFSEKMDGIRCIIHDGNFLSSSGKKLRNRHLSATFPRLAALAKRSDIYIEGELWNPGLKFQEIQSAIMSEEGGLSDVDFWGFDLYCPKLPVLKFYQRLAVLDKMNVKTIPHSRLRGYQHFQQEFEKVIKNGGEGLMLKRIDSVYKLGRATPTQVAFFKAKKFYTEEAKIIGAIEGKTLVDGAEKRFDEWDGSLKRSYKKSDRKPSGTLGAFIVDFHGQQLKIGSGFTDQERDYFWENPPVGELCEFKYMTVGMDKLPRLPVFLRIRDTE